MPTLYVVATPIGNLEDITLRAIRILNEVGLIAAEDTRKTRHLLNAYGIKTRLTSYHEHNKRAKLSYLLDCLQVKDLALVSEAGMPGLSDPGYELIVAATQRGIQVTPIPGASAVVTALVVSALPANQFTYLGFLPRKNAERIRLLQSIAHEHRTIVAFESPNRLLSSLNDMAQVLGNRRIAIVRELTKIHEEVFRGSISKAVDHFQQPRGEFTLVIEGEKEAEKPVLTSDIEQELCQLQNQGITAREAVKRLSLTTGLTRRELYQAWLKLKSNGGL
ncbi:MAG: 16S rRNA (cytidine(1402)-2'-O)-methyltransferase [Chloroflexi bacterium]|nr:16S rRNA (cytidine(1402)-2'-O)-methyltransferase [Chloroflexota bacterium]